MVRGAECSDAQGSIGGWEERGRGGEMNLVMRLDVALQ